MSEREQNIPETAEQVGDQLVEFIEKTEFGTPEYEAVSDYLHLRQLEQSLKTVQRNTLSNDDPEGKMHWGSQVKITEQEIALHKTQIYQRQSHVKGYDGAYTHVGIGFEFDLSDAARKEAKAQFAEDPEQQSHYVRNLVSTFMGKAEDVVHRKSN